MLHVYMYLQGDFLNLHVGKTKLGISLQGFGALLNWKKSLAFCVEHLFHQIYFLIHNLNSGFKWVLTSLPIRKLRLNVNNKAKVNILELNEVIVPQENNSCKPNRCFWPWSAYHIMLAIFKIVYQLDMQINKELFNGQENLCNEIAKEFA